MTLIIFNIFYKDSAEADPKKSYESYLSGKAVFIDVREFDELKDGMIKGALWYPLSKIEADKNLELAKIRENSKNKEIYFYCRSGNRAGKVQNYLENIGIKSINMGGFSNLVKEGLPTQPGPK